MKRALVYCYAVGWVFSQSAALMGFAYLSLFISLFTALLSYGQGWYGLCGFMVFCHLFTFCLLVVARSAAAVRADAGVVGEV